jgi:hypothetical protein
VNVKTKSAQTASLADLRSASARFPYTRNGVLLRKGWRRVWLDQFSQNLRDTTAAQADATFAPHRGATAPSRSNARRTNVQIAAIDQTNNKQTTRVAPQWPRRIAPSINKSEWAEFAEEMI